MTASFEIKNTGKQNMVLQMFIEGGRKHKKSDPVILRPTETKELTIFPGLNVEVSEEQQDEPITGEPVAQS